MPAKIVNLPDIGEISLYKRRGINSVKMSITHDGKIRVTLPTWAPYRLGLEFAKNKSDWILKERKPTRIIENGDRVGKAHRIVFKQNNENRTLIRIVGTDIIIPVPSNADYKSPNVQASAHKGAIKALKKEAEQLLPMRLQTLALQHGFIYNSVFIKKLKSRWGSCNEKKDITFNVFLMQLPWHLIDYVILHELMHTKVLRHGQPFWSALNDHVPNLKSIRKEMKTHQPVLRTIPGIDPSDDLSAKKSVVIETT